MKKIILVATLFGMLCTAKAQEEMTTIWETKLGHDANYTGMGLEGEVSYAASDKEMTVFKNDDASIVWTSKFKELAPNLRKIDELVPFWDSEVVFLFDRKMGADQIACIDLQTGKLLWTSDVYQNVTEDNIIYIEEKDAFALSLKKGLVMIKAKTGEEMWQTSLFSGVIGKYVYNPNDESLTMVNFKPGGLAAFFTGFKNQIVRMDINTGKMFWDQTYVGRAERKVLSREFIFDLDIEENKVILRMNGMQVYDYKTGTPQWSAAFDFTPDKMAKKPAGKILKMGVYGAVADPVIDGNFMYVLDMSSKKKQFVKKYDRNTGKLIWTSPEIKGGARAIPNMYVVNDRVVLQIGGIVEVQYQAEVSTTSGGVTTKTTTTAIEYQNVKPNGIQAFDTQNGAFVWESERFKKGITNMLKDGENILVCSGKSYYGINASSGADVFEVNVKDDGVGLATSILSYKGNVVVVGEKGLAMHDMKSGKMITSNKYKSSSLEDVVNNILIMKTAKADIAAYDLEDCSYREFKAKNGASTFLSRDADYVYIREKKRITKVATKG